jgi:isoaspartyl peptidase/L-asparaginase-like protein (Ntn-hydrolase superfamily)
MVDPTAHGIAPHQPGIERLQQIGRGSHICHSGIKPDVVGIWIENDWHAVVNGGGHGIRRSVVRMKLVLAKWACDRLLEGLSPEQASGATLTHLKRRLNGHGGLILLDRIGRHGLAHNTARMACGIRTTVEERSGIRYG